MATAPDSAMADSGSEHLERILAVVRHGLTATSASDTVIRSWQRCLNDYRLDPTRGIVPPILDDHALREHLDRLDKLIDCAKIEMTSLYQQLGDPDCAVVLAGRGGEILHMVSSPDFAKDVAPLGFRVGAVWSEQMAGTNGMGTCVAAGAPVSVCRTDHFFAQYATLTCSAVPVYDQNGAIAAVLDVTSRSQLLQQHSLVLLGMTAQTIENHLLDATFRTGFPIHFHSRPEFINTLQAGKVVVDDGGGVIGANRSALFQLGLPSIDAIRRCRFEDLFQTSLDELLERSLASSFHPVPIYATRASNRFFGVAQQPLAACTTTGNGTRPGWTVPPRPRAPAVRAAPTAEVSSAVEFGDPQMRKQLALAQRVIARRIPVLLQGETGVGKEVFAKEVHAGSPKSGGAFVAINCASLPESLIESELFGYRAGAFTGAQRSGRRGKILQADKGTLFLDEIGDMPLLLQARLLRVLDERRVTPLGAEETYEVDFQLISASHRDLEDCVRNKTFREDLYYRLSGVVVTLAPLRERADERALIERILVEEGANFALTDDAQQALLSHPWPGNVRQLRHVLRALAALYDGETVTRERLLRQIPNGNLHVGAGFIGTVGAANSGDGSALFDAPSRTGAATESVDDRQALLRTLELHRWNMSNVAKALAISRKTLYRRMHRFDIELSHSKRSA